MSDSVIRVRYRPGIVDERERVVHTTRWLSEGLLRSICGLEFHQDQIEQVILGGLPCPLCAARIALPAERPAFP